MVGFHELYERHWRDVYRFALFLSGNPTHAEDLASDTFVRAWNARGSIRESTVRAYLLTITRNLWRDMKRRSRGSCHSRTLTNRQSRPSGDQLVDLGWTERQLELVAAGDRAALLLHARDGLSYEEVARRLDISVGAVKSRVFRARQALDAIRAAPIEGDERDDRYPRRHSRSAAAVLRRTGERRHENAGRRIPARPIPTSRACRSGSTRVLKEQGGVPEAAATERRAFERTRMLLRYRNQTIGMAVAYSLLPFAFGFHGGQIDWILLRDKPAVGVAWLLTGIVCWIAGVHHRPSREAKYRTDERRTKHPAQHQALPLFSAQHAAPSTQHQHSAPSTQHSAPESAC